MSHSGKGKETAYMNAKQRRIAKQVIETQPINSDAPARVINVEDFIEARKFEIQAMENALKNATEFTGNMRVFQTLPRHMRRRAASYNVKRLPQRLRQRAIDQISNAKEKPQPVKKTRRARRRPGAIFEMFKKRSKDDKRWLDTHLWHAKRMHMGKKWGFMLALHPNDKSTRSSFRASQHSSIVYDASYYHCTQLRGNTTHIIKIVDAITDQSCFSVGSPRFLEGERQGSSFVHRLGKFPHGAVAPITFFWVGNSESEEKLLWIWIHPSAAEEFSEVLSESVKKSGENVEVSSLTSELSRFQLTGPRSHAILHEVLKVDPDCPVTTKAAEIWRSLKDLRTPASLPAGVVLGLTVYDPRLSFPPKMKPRSATPSSSLSAQNLHNILLNWPSFLANTNVAKPNEREKFRRMSPSELELDNQRSKNAIPGTELPVTDSTLRVPILLVQRSTIGGSSNSTKDGEFANGWDIIIPSGDAAVSFWKSFVFAGSHAIGLEDHRRICFENGVASFPEDFPETKAHLSWALEEQEKAIEDWNRKPVAKRVNYEKLGVESPFMSKFSCLVGSGTEFKTVHVAHGAQRIASLKQNLAVATSLENLSVRCKIPYKDVFVRCKLQMAGRGTADVCGIIYQPSSEELKYWTQIIDKQKLKEDEDLFDWSKAPGLPKDEEINAVLDKFPPKERIIGYVSNGGFSMAAGRGCVVGCCLVEGLLNATLECCKGISRSRAVVLVRGSRGRVCWPAFFQLIE